MIATMTVYDELLESVSPIVEHYRTDLDIDRQMIDDNPGMPFLHWTSESGTHLVMLHPADHEDFPPKGEWVPYLFGTADRYHILNGVKSYAECLKDTHQLVHYFDGKRLRKIDPAQAVKIASDYVKRVEGEWNVRIPCSRPYIVR